MEVRIGVQNAPRELTIDSTLDADGIEKAVADALKSSGTLVLADAKGRRVVVPADRLAYVEVTTTVVGSVGFRS